jgi:hypothetical protein
MTIEQLIRLKELVENVIVDEKEKEKKKNDKQNNDDVVDFEF